jgi:predicted dinucleotide-binding enzyme
VAEGYAVTVADPMSAAEGARLLGGQVEAAVSFESAVSTADAVVITTPWPEVRETPVQAFARSGYRLPVIDPWGLVTDTVIAGTAEVIALGRRRSQSSGPSVAAIG